MDRSKFKRKKIIRAKNGEVYLILSTSDIGVNVLKFKSGNLWKEIPVLKCSIEGDLSLYACIEGVSLMNWSYFEKKGFIVLSTMYDFKYNQIINTIADYYKGLIISRPAPDGLIYVDEYMDLENNKHENQSPSIEGNSAENIVQGNNDISGNTNSMKDTEISQVDISVCEENDNNSNSYESSNNTSENIKRYDLLTMYRDDVASRNINTNVDPSSKKKRKYTRTKYNYYLPPLTENECLEIAMMPTQGVANKYNLPVSVASGIRKKAKELFVSSDIVKNKQIKNNNGIYSKVRNFAKSGGSRNEALTEFDNSTVNYIYDRIDFSNSEPITGISIDDFLEQFKNASIQELYRFENMSSMEFAKEYSVSESISKNALQYIRTNLIAKDPYIICGFEYGLKENDVKKKDIYVYLSIEDIKDIYLETFDHHAEILAGTYELPNNIGRARQEDLIKVIKNRFYRKRYNNEIFSIEQKDAVESMNMDKIKNSFMVSSNRCHSLLNSYKARKKKEG